MLTTIIAIIIGLVSLKWLLTREIKYRAKQKVDAQLGLIGYDCYKDLRKPEVRSSHILDRFYMDNILPTAEELEIVRVNQPDYHKELLDAIEATKRVAKNKASS